MAGAPVFFSSPAEGASVEFGGTGIVAQTETDETGTAAGPSMRPINENGPVEILILAEKNGAVGNGRAHQMNLGFEAPPPTTDLELTKISRPGERVLRLAVKNEAGVPVAGATLTTEVLVKAKPLTMVTQSQPDGVAEFRFDVKSLEGKQSLLIRVEANGLTASRVIPARLAGEAL